MPGNRSTSAAATDSLIGQTIGGQYTLQRFLGHGSKARVFLATHRTLHRTVVVHLLSVPWADDSAAIVKFEEHARALRGIEHPNIAAVIDFGREPGRVFVVGEYVDGKLLSTYLKQLGRLTLEGFVPIAAQILKGLGATHARGLVHRDLKPTNLVLVEEQGRANYVKILDLGLAQILEGPSRGDDSPLVGTPEYLAPEQIMNKPVDPRTDVYALGVLFYQMVSGRLPFEGEGTSGPRSVLYKHVNDKPTPLTQALPLGSDVPDGLIDLIHDCLAKNPDNRPADANEIVERLIDSVPAALFRLPVVGASSTRMPTGEIRIRSATGDLPRAPTGEFRVPAARPEPLPQHDRALAAAVEASGLRPLPPVDLPGDTTTAPAPTSGGGSSWVLGILALLLTSGLVYIYIQNQNNAATPTQPVVARADGPAPTTAGEPAVDPADDALAADLSRARDFEAAGKLPEAIAAYEAVLLRDPAHAQARERIAALKAMAAPSKVDPTAAEPTVAPPDATAGEPKVDATAGEPKVDPPVGDPKVDATAGEPKVDPPAVDPKAAEPVHVAFLVEAYPKSEVFVDGVSLGKTPAKLDLLAGSHKFEIKAPGFLPHEETIEVAAEGQKSLKVKLVRKPPGTGGINRAEEDAASAQLDPENDAPTTKIEVPLKK